MISIVVQQTPADFQGPDIIDPLIVTDAMALSKGGVEISKNHKNRRSISGTCVLQPYMQPGSIVLYTDRQGNQFRALLKRSPLTIDRQKDSFTATTNIVMEFKVELGS